MRVFKRRFGEQDDKFLAAEARDDIRFAQRAAQAVRQAHQHQIADGVTVRVVDVFEVVGVNHEQAERMVIAFVALHFLFGQFVELAAVVAFGQRIARRLIKQFQFFLFAFRDVLESHVKRDFVLKVDDARRKQKPERFALSGFGEDFKIVDDGIFFQFREQIVPVRRVGEAVAGFESAGVFDVQPQQIARFGVDQHQLVVFQARNDNRERRHLNHQAQAFLVFLDFFFQRVERVSQNVV